MDLTQATEESLLHLKDDLVNDVSKKHARCRWYYDRVVFSTGYRDSCTWRCGRVGRYGFKYGYERSRNKKV